MLVIVEDRDLHPRLQPLLDLEALRRLDVFEIYAAKGRFERRDRRHHRFDFRRVDLDIEHVDAGELLEENGLPLHHGFRGEWTDIAEAEHGRAVGDDAHQIGAGGIVGSRDRIGVDFQTRRGDAGRIGERQIALVAQRLRRLDLQLSRSWIAMEEERGLIQIRTHGFPGLLIHDDVRSPNAICRSTPLYQNALI